MKFLALMWIVNGRHSREAERVSLHGTALHRPQDPTRKDAQYQR